MTATIPEEFIAAFNRVWLLPAGMSHNEILKAQDFLHFRKMSDKYCYAQVEGMFLDFFLLQGLQKLGVPCLFSPNSPLAAADMSEAVVRCHEALMKRQEHLIYLCPLDCADDIPEIDMGKMSIRRFSKNELDKLLNTMSQQRLLGYVSADTAMLSHFSWLVVRHDEALQAKFADRYWFWNAIMAEAGQSPGLTRKAFLGNVLQKRVEPH